MSGKVFISMADKYKADAVGIAKQLTDMGYGVVATRGTASTLMSAGACLFVLVRERQTARAVTKVHLCNLIETLHYTMARALMSATDKSC